MNEPDGGTPTGSPVASFFKVSLTAQRSGAVNSLREEASVQ